jgi:ATP-binding cassette subfamily B multidrug efflux pump
MDTPPDTKENRRLAVRVIRGYLGRYTRGLLVGGVCLVLTDVLLLANPWILKMAIDELHGGVTHDRLVFFALVFVGVTAASGVFRFLMRRIIIGISRKIEFDMRGDFFSHLQKLSPSFYNENRTGDLMALATNDLNAVRTLVGPGVMYSLNTLVVGVLSISLMLVLSWKLTIAALLPMGFLAVAVYHSVKVIHRLFERVQREFASINSRAQENLSGIRVVKAYAREAHEIAQFTELSQSYVDHNMKLFKVQSFLHPLLMTIAGLGGLFLLGVGGKLVIDGDITLGTFVAFHGYLTMMVWPTIALGWVMNILQRGLASMGRINVVMTAKPDITDPDEGARVGRVADHSVEFKNVSFAYNGGRELVLRDISFRVADGETVAIVGPTGAGKSTLISLILRLYDATGGEVLVGGTPVRSLPLETLRQMVGLVPQDIFLFSETIRENIAFGVPRLEDPVLDIVSETASIQDEIRSFPRGYESRIGERGINLSGGQKQRVAIARALAKQPEILILDDALSSVDANTEEKILGSMRSEMKKRTSIVISHRISTAREADRVIVLDDGRIVEEGRHEELVARGGIYAEMFHKQRIMVDLERAG